jgi:hypothetical protein
MLDHDKQQRERPQRVQMLHTHTGTTRLFERDPDTTSSIVISGRQTNTQGCTTISRLCHSRIKEAALAVAPSEGPAAAVRYSHFQ